MKSSDRIKDVLDKAKLLTDADLSQVNLSEKLTDQKLIYIPLLMKIKIPLPKMTLIIKVAIVNL